MTQIKFNKFWLTTAKELNIVTRKLGHYKIIITIYDIHNNREKYEYFYELTMDNILLDFDIFNSTQLITDNKLNQDIDSTTISTIANDNPIINLVDIPNDLTGYFNTNSVITKYLTDNSRYLLPETNKNYLIDNITETIPVDYLDNFIEILAYKYDSNYSLKLRIKNPETLNIEYYDYFDNNAYLINPDKLFVTGMEIVVDQIDQTITEKWVYISTIEVGINLIPELFDLVLINNNDLTDIQSVYDLVDLRKTTLPVNYNFPLFFNEDFIQNYPVIPINFIEVQCIFNKLTNIRNYVNSYKLKFGDIIVCKINESLITNYTDILWTIKNSFDNEILFQTKDYTLKYRINENIIYTIILEFKINNIPYTITKNAVQSSFDL